MATGRQGLAGFELMDHRLTVTIWSASLAIAVSFLFWKLAQMGAKRQRDNGFDCEIGRFPLLFSGGALRDGNLVRAAFAGGRSLFVRCRNSRACN